MTTVSLGDVLSKPVALGWAEAVAVMEELCTVLARNGGPGAAIPDPIHILLTADGAVTIRSDAGAASQQTTPGRLLHTLLASSDAPSPLRLFVSVAISSDRYDSVGTFGEALAYYEVPGRGQLIQAAYQRSAAPLVPVAATPLPVPELPRQASPVKAARPKVPTWAFAAGAAMLGASAVALWFSGVAPSRPGDAATPRDAAAVAEIAAVEKQDRARGTGGRDSASDARQGSLTNGGRRRSPADDGPRVRLTDNGGFFPNPSVSAGAVATSTPAPSDGAEPSGETIYSSASPDVQPPVPISPLPSILLNPRLESTGTIELLVNEEGNVAHVRLVSEPSRMQPMMLLSAAKTWTFRPALRDGRAVKFRLQVKVPSTLP
jgi:hypothetical protein